MKRKTLPVVILIAFSVLFYSEHAYRTRVYAAQFRDAARSAIGRVIPGHEDSFQIETIARENGLDVFEIENGENVIVVRGSSVPAALAGVNWYLKYYANAHISWTGDQLNLPAKLPPVPEKVRIVSPYKYRYMYNYCTFNYTMSFWDWDDWERELDFLAFNGVNLTLAVVGQEAVWQNWMREMKMSEESIQAFIPGPGFQAWWLMGNLEGWGGPVSQAWIDHQTALQKKILARMRELGMEPVLQGFYGMVPREMIAQFPNAKINETGLWVQFNRPAMIDPGDPLFAEAAAAWYRAQRELYGDAKFFGGDPFHEGGGADIDITAAGGKIQEAMLKFQPDASWVLQAWQSNPNKKMLDGTIKENTLILELFAEAYPQWKNREGFYGHPWVWNIISNFGGNTGMHGALWKVAQHPVEALNSPNRGNLVGIGAMMEASEQDAVLWDLLFDMAWRDTSPDLDKWISGYATRRYGKSTPGTQLAWNILLKTAYGPKGPESEPESPFCMRPSFSIGTTYGRVHRQYDVCDFARAWDLFIADADKYRGVDPFEHDLIDVSRQAAANLALSYSERMAKAFNDKNKSDFEMAASAFLDLLMDQDRMLETDTHFMLGKWIADARALGSTPEERDLFEWNARTQITVWGPRATSDSLHEYAHREWSGLLRGFYYMRWKMFVDNVLANWDTYTKKKKTGKDAFNTAMNNIAGGGKEGDPTGIDWFAVEEEWTRQREPYPATPQGDRIDEAKRMYDKHFPEVKAACGL